MTSVVVLPARLAGMQTNRGAVRSALIDRQNARVCGRIECADHSGRLCKGGRIDHKQSAAAVSTRRTTRRLVDLRYRYIEARSLGLPCWLLERQAFACRND